MTTDTDRRTKKQLLDEIELLQTNNRRQAERWNTTQQALHEALLNGGDLETEIEDAFGPAFHTITVAFEASFRRTSEPDRGEVREWLMRAWSLDMPCGIPDGHEDLEIHSITIHTDRQ